MKALGLTGNVFSASEVVRSSAFDVCLSTRSRTIHLRHQIHIATTLTQCMHYDVTFDAVAVVGLAPMGLVFLGCVASPFLSSSGMMSEPLARLMFLRQTGHCERRCSPGLPRFSPAIRASMRQVWQKR
jgi:hypothetical protein